MKKEVEEWRGGRKESEYTNKEIDRKGRKCNDRSGSIVLIKNIKKNEQQ
jgi:hypothetical protein